MDELTDLRELSARWRQSIRNTQAEIIMGLRSSRDEGPRYGMAAVEACADDLDALIAARVNGQKGGRPRTATKGKR